LAMNTFDPIFLTISHVIVLQPDEIINLGTKCNLEKSHTWFSEKCLKSVGRYPMSLT